MVRQVRGGAGVEGLGAGLRNLRCRATRVRAPVSTLTHRGPSLLRAFTPTALHTYGPAHAPTAASYMLRNNFLAFRNAFFSLSRMILGRARVEWAVVWGWGWGGANRNEVPVSQATECQVTHSTN